MRRLLKEHVFEEPGIEFNPLHINYFRLKLQIYF